MRPNPEEEDVWAEILNDVSTASLNKDKKTLVFLGDEGCGKTSLILKLRNAKNEILNVKQGLGLEFSFMNIKDHFSEDIVSRLSVWTLNSERDSSASLHYAFNDSHCTHSDKGWGPMVVIMVDYSKPWEIIERLEHWVKVLSHHLESLDLKESRQTDMCDSLKQSLQEYCMPESEGNKDILLPLGDTVLTENLGVPIAVVCTKVDSMTALEKDLDYSDAHFDLIQWHIRRFCLKYGAGLFYINGKDASNVDNLYKYIVHKLYTFPFPAHPSVIEKDGLMIPAGWDTDQKIGILNDTLRAFNLEESLKEVLNKPVARRTDTSREVKAEDDQAFLTRMQSLLANQKPRSPKQPSLPGPKPAPGGPPGAAGAPPNEGVLAVFFSSLLAKKPGAAGAPVAGAPRTGSPSKAITRTNSTPDAPGSPRQTAPKPS